MLPRWGRLPRAAFSALSRATRRRNEHFTTLLPSRGTGYAVVISKKTLSRAVDRHRLKRRVLEVLETLPTRPPTAVIYPKASALTLPPHKMRQELCELLSKTKMP